jgi:hypothetical protein
VEIHVKVDVNLKGVSQKLRALGEVHIPQELDALTKEVAYGIRDEAKTYEASPAPTGRPVRWKSERQRRYVMGAISRGEIQVPYRRTGDMSRQTVAYRAGEGWAVEMRQPYSHFVRGFRQTYQHARAAIRRAIERAGL